VAPTRRSVTIGLPIALVGQLLRIWAAGHLEKSREVTRSGPYPSHVTRSMPGPR
jgi:hypothetical protein